MHFTSVYLASASPRRLELLKQIGMDVTVITPSVIEVPQPSEPPLDYAKRLARSKAEAGWSHPLRNKMMPVIGADTIVVCDNEVLGKPENKEHGMAMLSRLSGRTHEVITAIAIVYGEKIKQCYVQSEVTFATLTRTQIEDYWHTGEACDKAGAYAIQGRAAAFISYLKGSYSSVVGLPLFETVQLLREISG